MWNQSLDGVIKLSSDFESDFFVESLLKYHFRFKKKKKIR